MAELDKIFKKLRGMTKRIDDVESKIDGFNNELDNLDEYLRSCVNVRNNNWDFIDKQIKKLKSSADSSFVIGTLAFLGVVGCGWRLMSLYDEIWALKRRVNSLELKELDRDLETASAVEEEKEE